MTGHVSLRVTDRIWTEEHCDRRPKEREARSVHAVHPVQSLQSTLVSLLSSWQSFKCSVYCQPLTRHEGLTVGALDIKNCNSPALIGYLLIKGSPGITGSWIPRAPMKGFFWHLHVVSTANLCKRERDDKREEFLYTIPLTRKRKNRGENPKGKKEIWESREMS